MPPSNWTVNNQGQTRNQPVYLINGPTASGKSSLAIRLAQRFNGVIINADSMQLYDAIPTLTAQPDEEELSQAPHRLYAVLKPSERTDAVQWRDMATVEIRRAHDQGQTPILVGGTGFYIQTLTEGLSPIPDVPKAVRQRADAHLADIGLPAFYAELADQDPDIQNRIDPHNPRRVQRAWEVFHATGKSLIHWQSLPKSGPPAGLSFYKIALAPAREDVYARCNARFEQMFDTGAVEEAKILKAGIDAGDVPTGALITKAIGFPETCQWLDGHIDKSTAIERAQQATRRYAKRQMTWLRNQFCAPMTLEHPNDDLPSELVNSFENR